MPENLRGELRLDSNLVRGSLDQIENNLLERLIEETRNTNRLLNLAFGEAIEKRVRTAADSSAAQIILSLLLDGDIAADSFHALARSRGLGRTSVYRQLAELERAGLVERPRRGIISLSSVVAPYVANLRTLKDGAGVGVPEVAAI